MLARCRCRRSRRRHRPAGRSLLIGGHASSACHRCADAGRGGLGVELDDLVGDDREDVGVGEERAPLPASSLAAKPRNARLNERSAWTRPCLAAWRSTARACRPVLEHDDVAAGRVRGARRVLTWRRPAAWGRRWTLRRRRRRGGADRLAVAAGVALGSLGVGDRRRRSAAALGRRAGVGAGPVDRRRRRSRGRAAATTSWRPGATRAGQGRRSGGASVSGFVGPRESRRIASTALDLPSILPRRQPRASTRWSHRR